MSKLVLISGGSRGLGAALCDHYLRLGHEVREFSRSGSAPYSIRTDLSRPEEAARILEREMSALAGNSYEEIVAINNAATLTPIGPAAKQDPSALAANVTINLTGSVLFTSRVIGAFQDHACAKTIINISSGASWKAYAGWSLYCMAKAGSEAFFRCAALEQEVAAHPFRLINVAPGVVDTEMQAAIRGASAEDFPQLERFLELKRTGSLRSPAEAAALIAEIVASRLPSGERMDVNEWLEEGRLRLQAPS
ncbi:SDR family NAD(P)-dependent oxidoreductase [Noviherbaspirillum galbum]|uniref:SDR family NAD(P)-dependent oxidoreductase n=1 Tax=Noviherbaspirillum galbum TaxID=2709383 RepID=A0A6B3SJP8_9BURK|nr:SDR family NAD(P)-dependent oxidoreductase [Noviherbaspirillum galbum]NEX61017.1 SDR family NAD(P)-dependent oxidoreductase [Noviherbaspirillum galbum]